MHCHSMMSTDSRCHIQCEDWAHHHLLVLLHICYCIIFQFVCARCTWVLQVLLVWSTWLHQIWGGGPDASSMRISCGQPERRPRKGAWRSSSFPLVCPLGARGSLFVWLFVTQHVGFPSHPRDLAPRFVFAFSGSFWLMLANTSWMDLICLLSPPFPFPFGSLTPLELLPLPCSGQFDAKCIGLPHSKQKCFPYPFGLGSSVSSVFFSSFSFYGRDNHCGSLIIGILQTNEIFLCKPKFA